MSHWAPVGYSRRGPPWGRAWKPAWGMNRTREKGSLWPQTPVPTRGEDRDLLGNREKGLGRKLRVCPRPRAGAAPELERTPPPFTGGMRARKGGREGMKERKQIIGHIMYHVGRLGLAAYLLLYFYFVEANYYFEQIFTSVE